MSISQFLTPFKGLSNISVTVVFFVFINWTILQGGTFCWLSLFRAGSWAMETKNTEKKSKTERKVKGHGRFRKSEKKNPGCKLASLFARTKTRQRKAWRTERWAELLVRGVSSRSSHSEDSGSSRLAPTLPLCFSRRERTTTTTQPFRKKMKLVLVVALCCLALVPGHGTLLWMLFNVMVDYCHALTRFVRRVWTGPPWGQVVSAHRGVSQTAPCDDDGRCVFPPLERVNERHWVRTVKKKKKNSAWEREKEVMMAQLPPACLMDRRWANILGLFGLIMTQNGLFSLKGEIIALVCVFSSSLSNNFAEFVVLVVNQTSKILMEECFNVNFRRRFCFPASQTKVRADTHTVH